MKPARIAPNDPRVLAFKPGPTAPKTSEKIAALRAKLAEKRAERPVEPVQLKDERREADRRVGPFDRRASDRRKYLQDPEPPTGFGDDLSPSVLDRLLRRNSEEE